MNSLRDRRRMREGPASGHIYKQWKLRVRSRVVSTDADLERSFKKSPTDAEEEHVIRYEQEERARRVSPQLRNSVQSGRRSPLIASPPSTKREAMTTTTITIQQKVVFLPPLIRGR